jgi:hypothetical protein
VSSARRSSGHVRRWDGDARKPSRSAGPLCVPQQDRLAA